MSSPTARKIIPVKQAVQNALEYVREFGDVFPSLRNARLEETEYDDKRSEWVITLSFEDLAVMGSSKRIYKQFRVNARSGEVGTMKMKAEV